MNNILITAIGSFSAEQVIKSLKNINNKIVGVDIYSHELVANSLDVDKFYKVPLAIDKEKYISAIRDISKKENVKYIIPLTDIEIDVINENREIFEKDDIIICISKQETINICRNKKILVEELSKYNEIPIIPTYHVKDYINDKIEFPVICKPYNGRSSEGVIVIKTQQQWNEFISKNDLTHYIMQPFIEGNIVTVDIVRDLKNNKIICLSRKEILRTNNGAGLSVYIFNDKNLNSICYKIATVLDVKGCVNFEFILDSSGNYHFIECNPRFSGGVAFSCKAGYNFVKNHMNVFMEKDIEDFYFKNNLYIAKRYTEVVTKVEE